MNFNKSNHYCLYTIIFLFFSHLAVFAQKEYKYPLAPKGDFTDVYFDTTITDPYQWMENPSDLRLNVWLEQQGKLTKKEENSHTRSATLKEQIASLYVDVKQKRMKSYVERERKLKSKYEFKNVFKNVSRTPDISYRLRGKGNFKTLVKVKDFQKNKGDNVVILRKVVNDEEGLVAIIMSHNGSDWREAYFFDLKTGERLEDHLKYLRTSSEIIWNGRNVYYDRYKQPEEGKELLNKAVGQELFYHKLGTDQTEDKSLYKHIDVTGTSHFYYKKMGDKIFFQHYYKHKDKFLKALSYANNDPESFYLKDFIIYPNDKKISLTVKDVFGDTVLIQTNWNAPNGKVLGANLKERNKLFEIIPEYDVLLRGVYRLGKDKIANIYRKEGSFLVLVFDLEGKVLKKIDIEEGKKISYLGEKNENAKFTEFCISSFYHPDLWYQINLGDLSVKPSKTISVPYDPDMLETRYVKYKSKDGTEVPMYITCKKGLKLNGKNPTIIYGYGGYGHTVEPSFDEAKALWLLHGGVLAIPNIRGGGAVGGKWAKEGRRLNKQNAIDDFISAAEYLIDQKYTNSKRLGINGGSHGGLLVGATITQRPELFHAAIIDAGALDMLRFEKFTVGSVSTNLNEFGSVSDSLDFKNLVSYSPLHNVKEGVKYPNVLLITGDHDDRVPPLHSFKFLATLQEKGDPTSKYLLYLTEGAGHGGALNVQSWIDQLLFKYYFFFDQLELNFY
ncbi:prolyl oligopeptidase family serine peptidase [Flammeovirga sp. SJP92]|uniref:prolyl oligopeptidase family serine peptidase n=1 Tax=Flammeovirga sp. SJP92 TaxID=1775430 RepID=UPI0007971E6C|nr:prolyl oligopeptidase family serine peptidase [Flammeovirga sp. SJP92]KXX67050.1 hypothetical protein AVL50_29195 [Flammeovirga sp. SJP92]